MSVPYVLPTEPHPATISATLLGEPRLLLVIGPLPPSTPTPSTAVNRYASTRGLSARQTVVLRRYLEGWHDKKIAAQCGCGEATIYEHWRRMARKCGLRLKSEVVADFHAFLGGAEPDLLRERDSRDELAVLREENARLRLELEETQRRLRDATALRAMRTVALARSAPVVRERGPGVRSGFGEGLANEQHVEAMPIR